MAPHILLSSESTRWETPAWFIELVRGVGPIAFDPATSRANPVNATEFCSQDLGTCGLRSEWCADGLVYINPPYGAHLSGPVEPDYVIKRKDRLTGERATVGVGRGWGERIASHGGERLALVPSRTETEWWKRLYRASSRVLLWSSDEYGPRINFVDPDTGWTSTRSSLASTVFYRGPRAARFESVFARHGTLIRRM